MLASNLFEYCKYIDYMIWNMTFQLNVMDKIVKIRFGGKYTSITKKTHSVHIIIKDLGPGSRESVTSI